MKNVCYIVLVLLVVSSAPLWAYTVSGKVYMGYFGSPVPVSSAVVQLSLPGYSTSLFSAQDGSFVFKVQNTIATGTKMTLKATKGICVGSTTWNCNSQSEVKNVYVFCSVVVNPNVSIQIASEQFGTFGPQPPVAVAGSVDVVGPPVIVQNFQIKLAWNPQNVLNINQIVPRPDYRITSWSSVPGSGEAYIAGQPIVPKPLPAPPMEPESFFDIFFEANVPPETPAMFASVTVIPEETQLMTTEGYAYPYQRQTDYLLGEPEPCQPLFLIDRFTDWQKALNAERPNANIRPTPQAGWEAYMAGWNEPAFVEGQPYPQNQFSPADLYVWGGGGGGGGCEEPGLVMVWGNDQMPSGNYASAWRYDYGLDPDLSNCTIQVTVTPPNGVNITAVSFAMIDVNGNIRSWWWAVPGVIPQGVATTVSINTAQTGIAAANPVASGYMSMPGFDITQVQFFDVDENFNYIFGQQPAPPPGGGLPGRAWNYWSNLTVTKTTQAYKGNYVKWSQPPVLAPQSGSIPLIRGWDEKSVYTPPQPPIMADDWLCIDNRPVTDFHWWGSFIGWTQPYLPPVLPKAFHIGIWTDVPAGPGVPFSHPGTMIWQHVCDNWVWNFAGYDLDPRLEPIKNEACFQFNQLLSQNDWFYQKPSGPEGTVYWLSIAAIYDPAAQVQYPWGWKTRPHFYNDDAVRIQAVQNGIWPPVLGAMWGSGTPVEYPQGTSWDLAFELTTNEKAYIDDPIPGDIGGPGESLTPDGAVNLHDLAIMAAHWLMSAP